jgi:hypothetical protein
MILMKRASNKGLIRADAYIIPVITIMNPATFRKGEILLNSILSFFIIVLF